MIALAWPFVALVAIGTGAFIALKFQIGIKEQAFLSGRITALQADVDWRFAQLRDDVAVAKSELDDFRPLLTDLPNLKALEIDVGKLRRLAEQNELSKLGRVGR